MKKNAGVYILGLVFICGLPGCGSDSSDDDSFVDSGAVLDTDTDADTDSDADSENQEHPCRIDKP
jgi:hypothetical protein